jgi:mRNA interferase MazF
MGSSVTRRGSVVLVRYPFSDLSGFKVRPAVVLTPDSLIAVLDDVLCLFVSSVIPKKLLPTDLVIESSHLSFPGTGLKHRSVLREPEPDTLGGSPDHLRLFLEESEADLRGDQVAELVQGLRESHAESAQIHLQGEGDPLFLFAVA